MMEGLGRLYDLSCGAAVQDAHTGAITGKRVSMKNASGVTVVVYKAAGTGGQDPVLTFNSFAAATGGSAASPAAPQLDHYYKKSGATALAGSEKWTAVTQAASNVVTLTGESTNQGIYCIEVQAGDTVVRTDPYLEVDIGSVAASQLVSVLYILHDLEVQRAPKNLASAQA